MKNSVWMSIMTSSINVFHLNQSFVESPLSFFLIKFYWTVVALQCREQLCGYQGIKGQGVGWIGRLGLIYIHYWYYIENRQLLRTPCIAQGTLLNVLWWLEGEGRPRGGDIHLCMADSFYCTVGAASFIFNKKWYIKKKSSKSQSRRRSNSPELGKKFWERSNLWFLILNISWGKREGSDREINYILSLLPFFERRLNSVSFQNCS